jgi:isoquinoline 1-oxidoreductase alpha subunit
MILAAVALLDSNPKPGEQDILRRMEGNVCRCGTYPRIVEAIQQAAARKGGSR